MTDHSGADQVVSGAPYEVVSINHHEPVSLADFVSTDPVTMTVGSDHQVVTISGSARLDGDSVLVYEKTQGGTGKDVRTWRVTAQDGLFRACERVGY